MKRIKKHVLVEKLLEMGFTPFSKITKVCSTKRKNVKKDEEESQEESEDEKEVVSIKEFNYLVNMPMISMSMEKVQKLTQEV